MYYWVLFNLHFVYLVVFRLFTVLNYLHLTFMTFLYSLLLSSCLTGTIVSCTTGNSVYMYFIF